MKIGQEIMVAAVDDPNLKPDHTKIKRLICLRRTAKDSPPNQDGRFIIARSKETGHLYVQFESELEDLIIMLHEAQTAAKVILHSINPPPTPNAS